VLHFNALAEGDPLRISRYTCTLPLQKLEWLSYLMLKTARSCLHSSGQNTGTWRTDRQTESLWLLQRPTLRAMQTRRKNFKKIYVSVYLGLPLCTWNSGSRRERRFFNHRIRSHPHNYRGTLGQCCPHHCGFSHPLQLSISVTYKFSEFYHDSLTFGNMVASFTHMAPMAMLMPIVGYHLWPVKSVNA